MQKYHIAYYYISPQNAERIELFRKASGDTEKGLITQYVRGWLGRNRQYYLDLARFDAEKRGMTFREWGEIVVTEGIDALPPTKIDAPPPNNNPLNGIAIEGELIQRAISYITLTRQNIALLRIGIYYDRDNAIGFISRIVEEHLRRNWDALYASQVAYENFKNWV